VKLKLLIGAVALAVSATAAAMPVSTFLAKADSLQRKGALAIFSGDLKLLMNQIKADAASLRADNKAAEAAGRRKAYCTPEGGVKLSNRDVTSACRQWSELNGRLPNHPSVLYNLGVCAEAAGSYADAQSFYRSAQAALPKRSSEMADSADRVARLMIARADDEERARRPSNPR